MKIAFGVMALAVFAAIVPAVSAQDDGPGFSDLQEGVQDVGNIDILVGPKAIEVAWTGIQLGGNLTAFLREKVDGLDGNDPDGEVSEEEADAAELLIRSFVKGEFDIYAHDERFNDYLLIDHTNAKGAEVSEVLAEGIVGPVASTDPITLGFIARVGFPTQDADVHTVKLDMGRYYFKAVDSEKAAAAVGDFTLSVGAAEGWSIDEASIQPGCIQDAYSAETGKITFGAEDVNCFTERSGVLIAFSITGSESSGGFAPGFEAPLLVLGLLGAGLAARRRLH